MKVIAVKQAFFNGSTVNVGDELEVPDTFQASWAVAENGAIKKPKDKAKATTPIALSQAGAAKAVSFVDAHAPKTDLA